MPYLRCRSGRCQSRPPIVPRHDGVAQLLRSGIDHAVVVIEQGVVVGQLLAGTDVTHGYQDDIAREAHVRLAGMIDEEHDRLILRVRYGSQVKAAAEEARQAAQPVTTEMRLADDQAITMIGALEDPAFA